MFFLRRRRKALCLNSAFFGFYAHAGFVQGLSEIGYRPDTITGSSAGALVGALYAAGMPPAEMISLMSQIRRSDFWEGNVLSHLFKPLLRGAGYSGLLSGQRLRRLLEPYLGGMQIEDLPIPLGIAAANVTRGRKELIRSGSLIDALLASMAFPVLFELQRFGADEYLDGGVADHEPITEFILDSSVGHILVHAVETPDKTSRLALSRAFAGGVRVIDHETRTLKEEIARMKRKKILRITTNSHALGPGKLEGGRVNMELGRRSAHEHQKIILKGR